MATYCTEYEVRRLLDRLHTERMAMDTILEYCYGKRDVNDPALKVAVKEHMTTCEVLDGYQTFTN